MNLTAQTALVRSPRKPLHAFLMSALFFSGCAYAQPWTTAGKVIYVDDGDTLAILLPDKTRRKIRLSDIDAPETGHGQRRPGQPFSNNSRLSLRELALGKFADLKCYDTDPRTERDSCHVFVDGININSEQVRRGMAYAYRANLRYVRSAETLALEDQAAQSKVGLWGLPANQRIKPWVWRKQCWQESICDQ